MNHTPDRADNANKTFFKRKSDLLRQAGAQVESKELTLLQFYALWRIYDDIRIEGYRKFLSAPGLAAKIGFKLRIIKEALSALENHGYLRCVARGRGRGHANEYEIGDGPGIELADNVVQLQPRPQQYTQKKMHDGAPFEGIKGARKRSEKVHENAPQLEKKEQDEKRRSTARTKQASKQAHGVGNDTTQTPGLDSQDSSPQPPKAAPPPAPLGVPPVGSSRRLVRRRRHPSVPDGQASLIPPPPPPPPPQLGPMPLDFELTPWMKQYAVSQGIADERVPAVFKAWKGTMISKSYTSANWEQGAWLTAVEKRLEWDKQGAAKQQQDSERQRREDDIWKVKGPQT